MVITHFDQLDLNKRYSYFDYLLWRFDERVELFKGKVFKMSPAPASSHQRISSEIGYFLTSHLRSCLCQVFYAPFDVRLERNLEDRKVFNVVQPDICVICDPSKIDEKGCVGAPELVVEILSPGNTKKELGIKFDLYEESGVLEYWIVDPAQKIVLQYFSESGKFVNHRPLTEDDILTSRVIDNFHLSVSAIFAEKK